MNDLRLWPRNPESPTGRFIIPTGCKCMHCEEKTPWRMLLIIASALAACLLLGMN